ncbi:MAG: radical SAM protein [Thermoplasmata archaeon]
MANRFAISTLFDEGHSRLMVSASSVNQPRRGGGGRLRPLLCARGCAFGPVPSRRLGQSLGVNTVPRKTCTYSCVYCQLGPTTNLTVKRRAYYDADTVAGEIRDKQRRCTTMPDYVTFLGCGEPTLASNMADILKEISKSWKGKTALLTNGSLMSVAKVRASSMHFDVVMPTVAADSERTFKTIHRPHPSIRYPRVLAGLKEFSQRFPGELWVEVMLLKGVNDDSIALEGIRKNIELMDPDRIHLMAPTRPPSEEWVECPTEEGVERAVEIIPGSMDMTRPEAGTFGPDRGDVVEELCAIARVHPMREKQAIDVFLERGFGEHDALEALKTLRDTSRLKTMTHKGEIFYIAREEG